VRGGNLSDNWRMPTFYKIDKERRVVISSGSGVVTLADGMAHQQRLLNDPDFDPSFSQIADFAQITQFEISASDLEKLAEKNIFSAQSRRALIVPTDVGFGLGRMFEIMRENLGEENIRIFRNLDEALDWVLSKEQRP